MIRNILVPLCREPEIDIAFQHAIEIAERVGAHLIIAVAAAVEREDVTAELPGLEPSPVEKAVGEEPGWPKVEGEEQRVPDIAAAAVSECEERRIARRVIVTRGSLVGRVIELSKLADLLVACAIGRTEQTNARALWRLAMAASCPCLVCGVRKRNLRRMAAYYDGSAVGARALRAACELAAGLNMRMSITVSGKNRLSVQQQMAEGRMVAVAYNVEHDVEAVVGLRPEEFVKLAEEAGADVIAGPRVKGFVKAALTSGSAPVLVGD